MTTDEWLGSLCKAVKRNTDPGVSHTRQCIIIHYQNCFSRISGAQETPKTAVWGYRCTSRCMHCWPLCVLQEETAATANPQKRRWICESKRLAFLSLIVPSNDHRSPMPIRSYSITILLGKTWLVASECRMVKPFKLNILHQITKKNQTKKKQHCLSTCIPPSAIHGITA